MNRHKLDQLIFTRRNLIKYAGLGAIAGLGVTVVGKTLLHRRQKIIFTETSISNNKYEFDVITVNDLGEEIKRYKNQAQYFTEDLGNDIILEMVAIPGGTFIMGAPATEQDSYSSERPQHQVTIPAFYISKFPITQEQWKAIAALPKVSRELNLDPSFHKGAKFPVEQVSWHDTGEFCARLSQHTGKSYKLPSEAQWEYAARGGTTTPFYFGETITIELANYRSHVTYKNEIPEKYREETTPVGTFPPNSFGLYDMHGLVWQWCEDTWHENYQDAPSDGSAWVDNQDQRHCMRGGSWYESPEFCRSAEREVSEPSLREATVGFRCILLNPYTISRK